MDNKYHEYWDRDNFSFHRTDPKPWIHFEEDESIWGINWKRAGYWLLCVLIGLPVVFRWYPF
jgi:hypothetical protein